MPRSTRAYAWRRREPVTDTTSIKPPIDFSSETEAVRLGLSERLARLIRAAARNPVMVIAGFVGTIIIDVHGDLHIGQVLRTSRGDGLSIIDFDGSPTRSPEQRLARQPAARDVAGMLASLDHVGRVVLHRTEGLDDGQRARVHDWIASAQKGFLDAYLSRLAEAGEESLLDVRLVRPFQLQQECREFIYAARYLPHWRYAPEGALASLLEREFERPSITMRERHET